MFYYGNLGKQCPNEVNNQFYFVLYLCWIIIKLACFLHVCGEKQLEIQAKILYSKTHTSQLTGTLKTFQKCLFISLSIISRVKHCETPILIHSQDACQMLATFKKINFHVIIGQFSHGLPMKISQFDMKVSKNFKPTNIGMLVGNG